MEDQLPAALFAFGPAPGPELDLGRDVIGGEATMRQTVSAPGDRFNAQYPKGTGTSGPLAISVATRPGSAVPSAIHGAAAGCAMAVLNSSALGHFMIY